MNQLLFSYQKLLTVSSWISWGFPLALCKWPMDNQAFLQLPAHQGLDLCSADSHAKPQLHKKHSRRRCMETNGYLRKCCQADCLRTWSICLRSAIWTCSAVLRHMWWRTSQATKTSTGWHDLGMPRFPSLWGLSLENAGCSQLQLI